MDSLFRRVGEVAQIIKRARHVHVVTHIDADGLTAGSIAIKTLERLGKESSIEFVKQLDSNFIRKLKEENHELVWFTDLGSDFSHLLEDINAVITDHHECSKDFDVNFNLNPHLFNYNGAYEISGAGVTYLVAKSIDKENIDLSPLAIVGACGDLQDRKYGKLIGLNRDMILKDSKECGCIEDRIDIRYFGRETKPLPKLLQHANDPILPGLTGREEACIDFLQRIGVRLKNGDNWRRWIDLSKDERRLIVSSITKLLLSKGFGYEITKRLLGEVYILIDEIEGTEVHEAREFATLLNSTARYGMCDVGLKVCLGDRGEFLKKAQELLLGHKASIFEGIQFAKEEGIVRKEYLQFFHAGKGIRDTIIGIITNMLLNSEDVNNDLPIVGFVDTDNGEVKISARGTEKLVERGLNLSVAVKKAASAVNGIGGGHSIAAGATIPKGKEEEFLYFLEKEIKNQLKF